MIRMVSSKFSPAEHNRLVIRNVEGRVVLCRQIEAGNLYLQINLKYQIYTLVTLTSP